MSSAPSTPNGSTTASAMSLTSSAIVVFVLILVFVLLLLGTMAVLGYQYCIRRQYPSNNMTTLHANDKAYALSEAPTSDKLSLWSAFSNWVSPPASPELPWPVLATVPALRPKEPIHRRALNGLAFWKKDEYHKPKPFTITDVINAIDEVEGRAASAAALSEKPSVFKRFLALFKSCLPSSQVQVPDIVVYPCDGSPAFAYIDDDTAVPLSPTLSATPSSPESTLSEPDSPALATPSLEPSSLDVPMPSSTAPRSASKENREVSTNVSNFSGKQFVLSAPPTKSTRQNSPDAAHLGLGFGLELGLGLTSHWSVDSDLADVFADASAELTPSDSDVDCSKRYAGLVDALSLDSPRSSISTSPGSSVSVYGGIESYGYESDASGTAGYFECSCSSTDSDFALAAFVEVGDACEGREAFGAIEELIAYAV